MTDAANNVIDSRLQDAISQYFNGVTLRKTIGDCAVLSGVRKQNGAPVDIYTPSYTVARDDAAVTAIAKEFETYNKLSTNRLQSPERLLTTRTFKKSPALAVLSCPVDVFDEAFDTRSLDLKLRMFDEILEGLAILHAAKIVHGNISPAAVRREDSEGALRLCDFTFSGDRTTQMTAQPPAYQSRHVINSSQPRFVDDVHAAGMIGYRILLGPNGAEQVLTGRNEPADPDSIVSAVLGEEIAPPSAADLMPESHPSGEAIARLLARMIGRLPNTAAYSTADAARKAFRSVLDNPTAGISAATGQAPTPMPAQSTQDYSASQAQQTKTDGVSKGTALALFGGLVASVGGAVYFYFQADGLETRLLNGAAKYVELKGEHEATKTLSEERLAAFAVLRQADQVVIEARLSGANSASAQSALEYEASTQQIATSEAALLSDAPSGAVDPANAAILAAKSALQSIDTARQAAFEAAEISALKTTEAELAEATALEEFTTSSALRTNATSLNAEGRFEEAGVAWLDAASGMDAAIAIMQGLADKAREGAEAAKAELGDDADQAGLVLAGGLMDRALAAYNANAFGEAAQIFDAAAQAFGRTGVAPIPATIVEARQISLGDNAAALSNAVQLCLDFAPIAASNCPTARPQGEAERSGEIMPFVLDTTEISAGQFAAFVADTSYVTEAEYDGRVMALTSSGEARLITGDYSWATPNGKNTTFQSAPNLPVINISMKDAATYCEWAGARLPTEAEWEYGARGDSAQAFPWGSWTEDRAIWRGAPDAAMRLPTQVTAAGGETTDGIVGLAGNAREWVIAPDGAVLKGGSWNSANPADLRISARLSVANNAPGVDFGFRCARDQEAWQ